VKITCLSDTHMRLDKVPALPGGDTIVHSGDLTGRGEIWEMERELKKLGDLKKRYQYVHCIYVAGNHDWLAFRDQTRVRELCKKNGIIYLQDEEVTLDGVRFYGSPWQPAFCGWAFNLPRGEALRKVWDQIPTNGIDYLITHGPPYGILDEVVKVDGTSYHPPELVGCADLLNRLLHVKPKVHQFGHIHCASGEKTFMDIKFINASMCDEMYMVTNPVREVEI